MPFRDPFELFMAHGGHFYKIPRANQEEGVTTGYVRAYGRPICVEEPRTLGELVVGCPVAWARLGDRVTPDRIVVLKAKIGEEEQATSNAWGVLLAVRHAAGYDDFQIFRPLPREAYRDFLRRLRGDARLATSSLYQLLPSEEAFASGVDPVRNGWDRVRPRSAAPRTAALHLRPRRHPPRLQSEVAEAAAVVAASEAATAAVEAALAAEAAEDDAIFLEQMEVVEDTAAPDTASRRGAMAALRVIADEVFALQDVMPEGTYLRLNAALKRAHEQAV